MFQNFPVSRSLDKKEGVGGSGGLSQFSFRFFLSHSADKFRRGNFLCFRNFMLSINSMDKTAGWGDYHDFSSEAFCRTVPKRS